MACRNFVQLCMEGYYDNTVFHRIIKDFIVQGGDPTATGTGGESIYGEPFKDEFHSRLRFSHRGLLAMANTGPNSNTSQFFFTLAKTEGLERRNTIFGKVVGDTVFNLVNMGELQVDLDDRPKYPPSIKNTTVLYNPFDDIVPRVSIEDERMDRELEDIQPIVSKPVNKKNLSLLSFEDEELDDGSTTYQRPKIKSIHDAIDNDPTLSKNLAVDLSKIESHNLSTSISKLDLLKQSMRKVKLSNQQSRDEPSDSDSQVEDTPKPTNSKLSEMQQEAKRLQSQIKSIGSDTRLNRNTSDDDDKKGSGDAIKQLRDAYLKTGKAVSGRDKHKKRKTDAKNDPTVAKLNEFQSLLKQASQTANVRKNGNGTAGEAKDDEWECDLHFVKGCESCRDTFGQDDDLDDDGWMNATLHFRKVVSANVYEPKVDDYEVVDPRER